jgi:UDP-N-acetylmuramoyl-tripeptide--D-alanyl-D-alanine ligase
MNTSTLILYSIYTQHPIISTDTRKLIAGSIFFGLSGPTFNGNQFAKTAIENGCAYAVIDQAEYQLNDKYILVDDVLKSLQQLALYHRNQMKAIIIGITGSNGKTTTKELLLQVLSKKYKTLATVGNLNNHIGVPLTLLQLTENHEMAIVEMGASKQGDIKELVEIAEPDFGLITNIGKAHLEGMGGYEGVIKTKTELYDFIRNSKRSLFVNTNHTVFEEKSKGINQITFGSSLDNDVIGTYLGSSPFVRMKWKTKNESELHEISTQLMGGYNFENILAAIAVGVFFKVPAVAISEAVSSYSPTNNRSQLLKTTNNSLILDAYNANPTSMEAAILNFKSLPAENKVVIIGKMMELGETSALEHQKLVQLIKESSFTRVFLVGEPYKEIVSDDAITVFNNVQAAISHFENEPLENCTILIKGSRANQLELLQPLF